MSIGEQLINYLKDRKVELEKLHSSISQNNNVSTNKAKRNLDRSIIGSQALFVATYSLFFMKIVLFNHSKRFNIPKKFLYLWFYQMTIDPLTLGAGFTGSLLYTHFDQFQNKETSSK